MAYFVHGYILQSAGSSRCADVMLTECYCRLVRHSCSIVHAPSLHCAPRPDARFCHRVTAPAENAVCGNWTRSPFVSFYCSAEFKRRRSYQILHTRSFILIKYQKGEPQMNQNNLGHTLYGQNYDFSFLELRAQTYCRSLGQDFQMYWMAGQPTEYNLISFNPSFFFCWLDWSNDIHYQVWMKGDPVTPAVAWQIGRCFSFYLTSDAGVGFL